MCSEWSSHWNPWLYLKDRQWYSVSLLLTFSMWYITNISLLRLYVDIHWYNKENWDKSNEGLPTVSDLRNDKRSFWSSCPAYHLVDQPAALWPMSEPERCWDQWETWDMGTPYFNHMWRVYRLSCYMVVLPFILSLRLFILIPYVYAAINPFDSNELSKSVFNKKLSTKHLRKLMMNMFLRQKACSHSSFFLGIIVISLTKRQPED